MQTTVQFRSLPHSPHCSYDRRNMPPPLPRTRCAPFRSICETTTFPRGSILRFRNRLEGIPRVGQFQVLKSQLSRWTGSESRNRSRDHPPIPSRWVVEKWDWNKLQLGRTRTLLWSSTTRTQSLTWALKLEGMNSGYGFFGRIV